MTRWVLGLMTCAVGCSVPTAVGELQSAVGDGQTSSTTDAAGSEVDPGTTTDEDGGATLQTSGSSSGSDSGSGSTGAAVAPEMNAFVIRWGDVPDSDTDSNSTVGSGGELDPDALLVTVGFTANRCEEPFDVACGTWDVSFTLDVDQQMAATFEGATVNATFSEVGEGTDPNDCAGYGGGTFETTVVIESIDDTGVQLRFENVDSPPFDADVELEGFTTFAPRC